MRTLINICNEFEIFRLRLKKSSVTYNNLFAFIVYKNIYPKDYSDLLENKGFVFEVFSRKKDMIEVLEDKIKLLKNKSTNGLGSIITDKNDIAMLFGKKMELHGKMLTKNGYHKLSFSNSSFSAKDEYMRDGHAVFNYFLKEGIDGEFTISQNNTPLKKYSSMKEFSTINSVNYFDLYRDFDEKKVQKEEEIQTQVNDLLEKINYVETKSVARLIKEDGIDLHINLSDKKLLYFLIRNNWLNESYEDYLTVFREGSISKRDNEFIQEIKLGYNKDNLHVQLKNVKKVAEKVRVDDISSIAVLNINLIKFLLENDNETSREKLTKIVKILFSNAEQQYMEEFLLLIEGLKGVTMKVNLVNKFLNILMEHGIDLWEVTDSSNVSKIEKETYAITIIEKFDLSILKTDTTDRIQDFISNEFNVERINNTECFWSSLNFLGVRFASVSSVSDESILEKIKQINSYQINLENMRHILNSRTVTVQLIKRDKEISDYCLDSSNIEKLINNVLVQQDGYLEEEEVFIKFVEELVDRNFDSAVNTLIHHWTGVINQLKQIESFVVIRDLFNENKFKLTWNNINFCKTVFEKNEEEFDIGKLLLSEKSWTELIENSTKQVQKIFREKEKYNSFVNSILENHTENSKIEAFIGQLEFQVEIDENLMINSDMIKSLIDYNKLSWSMEVYHKLNSVKYKILYIKENVYSAKEDLPELIENHDLVWSMDLVNIILELDNFELDLIQQYIRHYIEEIEYNDLQSIIEINILNFDSDIISELDRDPNKNLLLIPFLIQQWHKGFTSEVADIILNYFVPWSEELFKIFIADDLDTAANYVIRHLDEVNEIYMSQDLFDSLIKKSSSEKSIVKLVNQYINRLEISNQISEKLYEVVLNDPESILQTLNKKAVINVIEMLSLERGARFLYHFLTIKGFNREMVFQFLSRLIPPFNSIKLNGGQIKFETEGAHLEELLNYLQSNDLKVISSYVKNEYGYLVNNKRR
jgi:hypothetical protein